MKKLITSVSILFLLALCFACSRNGSMAATLKEKVVVTEYATFKSHPVQIVLDPNDNTVELRIRFDRDDNTIFNDDNLDFLKKEVLRLISGQTIQLGKTGYTFQFLGGYPEWAPYDGMYLDFHYKCLHFATQASIANGAIVARGNKNRDGFDGYTWWQPRYNSYK